MRQSNVVLAALALSLASSPAAAAGNLVVNGGFENNGLTGWTNHNWVTNFNGVITGNYSASNGCVGDSCIHNPDGSYSTNGSLGAFIYQDIATTAGTLYTLSFDYGAAGTTNELAVLFGGTVAFDQLNLTSSNTTYNVHNLLATSSTTRLTFLGRQDPGYSRLDNISLVVAGSIGAVPEPASWAMMLLGFAAIGYRFRRKTSTASCQVTC